MRIFEVRDWEICYKLFKKLYQRREQRSIRFIKRTKIVLEKAQLIFKQISTISNLNKNLNIYIYIYIKKIK